MNGAPDHPRPRFESDRDRKSEDFFRRVLEDLWHVRLTRTPDLTSWDFNIIVPFSNVLGGYVEFKMRGCRAGTYTHYFVFQNKIDRAIYIAEQNLIPFILVVKFTDIMLAIELTRARIRHYPLERNGRVTNPRDSFDVQYAYHIPVSDFVHPMEIRIKGVL